jgi:hypothetical protein
MLVQAAAPGAVAAEAEAEEEGEAQEAGDIRSLVEERLRRAVADEDDEED